MNFLAHAYLSGENESVLFGNFIADSVKGKMIERYDSMVKEGILLHRAIDNFTDSNAVVAHSVEKLRPKFRKYAPVVLDIYYDHFLAANWQHYETEDLADYTTHVYKILIRRYFALPQRVKRILPWMIAQNWLCGYANFNDLQQVFNGMSRRASHESEMQHAVVFLKENYTFFETDFFLFFNEVQTFCKQYLYKKNLM